MMHIHGRQTDRRADQKADRHSVRQTDKYNGDRHSWDTTNTVTVSVSICSTE